MTAIKVFGGFVGLTGKVGSLTLAEESPEKFFIAIIRDNRFGTSPGKFAELGASPIIVKIEFISC